MINFDSKFAAIEARTEPLFALFLKPESTLAVEVEESKMLVYAVMSLGVGDEIYGRRGHCLVS